MANNINSFFKENRREQKNEFFAASKQFVENDKPIKWELKHFSSKRMQEFKQRIADGAESELTLTNELVCEAVVFPNLRDSELQNSYGVKNQVDLLCELLLPAELDSLTLKVLEMNGYYEDIEHQIKEAKN